MLAKAHAGDVAVELALLLLVLAHTITVAVSGGGDSPEGSIEFLLLVSEVELTSDTAAGLLVGGGKVFIAFGLVVVGVGVTVESILINGGNCLSCGGSR